MEAHSSTLAWKIPWTEDPGGLQSMGSLRVGHDWATSLSLFTFMHWRRKWQLTPVFLPGESQGWHSLVGCRLWGRRVGHDWSDLAAAGFLHLLTYGVFHRLCPFPLLVSLCDSFFRETFRLLLWESALSSQDPTGLSSIYFLLQCPIVTWESAFIIKLPITFTASFFLSKWEVWGPQTG